LSSTDRLSYHYPIPPGSFAGKSYQRPILWDPSKTENILEKELLLKTAPEEPDIGKKIVNTPERSGGA
jgi:hypothetical protein